MEGLHMSRLIAALLLALTCISCQTEARHMNQARIDKLFEKTKPVCFGRFVVDVPATAQVVPGPQAFGATVQSFPNDASSTATRAKGKRAEIQAKSQTIEHAEVISLLEQPSARNWTLTYWKSANAKKLGIQEIEGYLSIGPHGFTYFSSTAPREGRTFALVTERLDYIATHLRARDPAEVPKEPGVCLDVGFIADDTGKFQEIFGVGLRFPELPDASFSISTNKDAQQGDSFEDRRAEAKRAALMVPEQAGALGKIKTLREGKLKVSQGEGSEALFRRPITKADGHWHEFQFEYAGKRLDHHNPSWDAALFTGVERDQAGSVASSLSDDEAIALWDRLMASVRLRVVR